MYRHLAYSKSSSSYSCKKLKPIYDTLGERFANVKSKLTIAKFDATENDIPASAGFKVQGFPTISKLHPFFASSDELKLIILRANSRIQGCRIKGMGFLRG